MTGTLYIVATPIGNLEDITIRGLQTLSEVDIILAEDTRVTGKLLTFVKSKLGSDGSPITVHVSPSKALLLSYHQHSSDSRKLEILKLLLDGKNIALVTDAGTPGISDPGNELVSYLTSRITDLKVVPIPGVSAITTALSISGMNVNKFVFLGFLPKKKRTKLFSWLKEGNMPFGFYESPQRIVKTLGVLSEAFGPGKNVFIARELTKMYETLYRGTIAQVSSELQKEQVRGEVVVVVEC